MKNLLVIFLILFILMLPGCNQATPAQSAQIPEHFRQSAKEIAGNIINGLAKQDYETFSKDFDPKMKAAISSAAMVEMQKLLWTQNGEFQTLQTIDIMREKGYFIGNFKLTFEKGKIVMRVVYSSEEPYHVSGLWFPTY